MSIVTGTYLDRILERTIVDLEDRKRILPQQAIGEKLGDVPDALPFERMLQQECVSVIAEFKRASPSKGRFPVEINPGQVASDYISGGARGISCLTDTPFFQGSLEDLAQVVEHAHAAPAPVGVLRKDFMIDPYQIDEARLYGADCILLIVAALDDSQLVDFREHASGLGMTSLVEVHDEAELERAMRSGANLLGINNRDLRSFNVDLATTERLAARLPEGTALVAESGIFTVADVERMAAAGASAVLIGESLIVHPDRVSALRQLAGVSK